MAASVIVFLVQIQNQSAPKERRRRRAEKRLSKRVFLESPFLLCPLNLRFVLKNTWMVLKTSRGQSRSGLSKNTFWESPLLRTTPSPLLWRAPTKGSFGWVGLDTLSCNCSQTDMHPAQHWSPEMPHKASCRPQSQTRFRLSCTV